MRIGVSQSPHKDCEVARWRPLLDAAGLLLGCAPLRECPTCQKKHAVSFRGFKQAILCGFCQKAFMQSLDRKGGPSVSPTARPWAVCQLDVVGGQDAYKSITDFFFENYIQLIMKRRGKVHSGRG